MRPLQPHGEAFRERAQRLAQAGLVAARDQHPFDLRSPRTFSDSTIALSGPIAVADIDR